MIKVLYINKRPLVTSYLGSAIVFSILENTEDNYNWIYSNFVNFMYEKEDSRFKFLRYFRTYIRFDCPLINSYKIPNDIFLSLNRKLSDYIIEMINIGYYVFLPYDTFYISGSRFYKKVNIYHYTLINGYDNARKIFMGSDFWNGVYCTLEISFNEIMPSYESHLRYYKTAHIELFKNNNTTYMFDNKKLLSEINDYLNCTYTPNYYENTSLTNVESEMLKEGAMCFGYSVYDHLQTKIISTDLDYTTAFHAIYDHKTLMTYRLNYLQQKHKIDNIELINIFLDLQRISLINRNLYLKYKVHKNDRLLNKICDNIENIMNMEIIGYKSLKTQLQ